MNRAHYRRSTDRREPHRFRRPLQLRYEKENVLAVVRNFEAWLKSPGAPKLKELGYKDSSAKGWRAVFGRGYTAFRRAAKSDSRWNSISEDMLDALVAAMQEYGVLTVRDDSCLVRALDGYLYHALVAWLGRDEQPAFSPVGISDHRLDARRLAGQYVVYQPSVLKDGYALVGRLDINATDLPRNVATQFVQQLDGARSPSIVEGTIVLLDEARCIWLDRNDEGIRFNKLDIVHPIRQRCSLRGWSNVNSYDLGRPSYLRKMFVEPLPDEKVKLGYVALDDASIPERLREHLVQNGENILSLPRILDYKLGG